VSQKSSNLCCPPPIDGRHITIHVQPHLPVLHVTSLAHRIHPIRSLRCPSASRSFIIVLRYSSLGPPSARTVPHHHPILSSSALSHTTAASLGSLLGPPAAAARCAPNTIHPSIVDIVLATATKTPPHNRWPPRARHTPSPAPVVLMTALAPRWCLCLCSPSSHYAQLTMATAHHACCSPRLLLARARAAGGGGAAVGGALAGVGPVERVGALALLVGPSVNHCAHKPTRHAATRGGAWAGLGSGGAHSGSESCCASLLPTH